MTPPVDTDHNWTDGEDRPYGGWVPVGFDEHREIVAAAGGIDALSVFSTLTDPDGCYGRPQVYTAWGREEDPHPLVDARDYKEDGRTVEAIRRKFVVVPPVDTGQEGRAVGSRAPSESFARLTDGGLAFSFEVGVTAAHVPALIAEGKRLWQERWGCDPTGWRDEDYVRHAIAQSVQGALNAAEVAS